jgi:peptidoglycan/LPS O-acetylase OafA/YrhL
MRVPALDGIRGVAVLWVVLFHATNTMGHTFAPIKAVLAVTQAGWFGVEIFFALSGFLITGILIDSKHRRDYFQSFYWRRTLRIFPIYFGVLILLLIIPWATKALQTEGWWRFVDLQPWFWLYGTNSLRELHPGQPIMEFDWFELTHLWSLAVEEHFYLVWPLLVYLLTRRQLWATALALMAFSTCLQVLPLQPLTAAVLATPKHLIALCIGACLAMWVREHPGSLQTFLRYARPLEARWLVFLGTYSYGLYLYHYLFAPLWRKVDLATWPGGYTVGMICFTALYLGLPLLVAVASFHLVEAPIMRRRPRPVLREGVAPP